MKKSRVTIKLDRLLSDKFFEQIWKDRPDLLHNLRQLKEYNDYTDHQSLMRQRIRKVNKLRNELNRQRRI